MKNINIPVVNFNIHFPLLLLLMIFFGSAETWAKPVAPDIKNKNATSEITQDTLQAKIETINTRQGLDETLKSKVLSIYQSAQDNLGNRESFEIRISEFKKDPEKTRGLQKEIGQALLKVSKQKKEDFSHTSTEELDQRLIIEKEKISSLDEHLKQMESELVLQQARPPLIRTETVTATQDLEAIQKKLAMPSDTTSSTLETDANRIYMKTLLDSRTTELKMLAIEAISNPARVELLKTESRLLGIQKNALTPVITAIENPLTQRRQQEAKAMQEALSQAEKELSGKHPLIQALTRENIQYSRDLQAITAKIANYTEQKTKDDALAIEIEDNFKSAEKKINLAGLSSALGNILHDQQRNLVASQDQFSLQAETIKNETAITSLEQFKVEDKLKQLSDIDAYLKEIMTLKVDPKLPIEQRASIQSEVGVLLNSQKELLNKLADINSNYLRTLGDFDFSRIQMVSQANKFATFLSENLLWVKSADPVDTRNIAGLFQSIKWLLSPLNWMALIKDALLITMQNPFLIFIGILSLVILLWCKKWSKLQLTIISAKVEKIYTDDFSYTLQALAYTLIIVLPIPLFIYYLGWVLSSDIHVVEFTRAIGKGLQSASIPLLFLQFFYRLFADEGIAHKHFQWEKYNIGLLRKQFAWLRFVAVLAVFIINSTSASKVTLYSDNLGRLALIISMVAMAVFAGRLLNPNSGLLQNYIKTNPDRWISKLRYIWYTAIICIPIVIIGFAVTGYYLSALELQAQLVSLLRLIFLMAIIHKMVIRWLTLVNRQLAITNARKKHEAAELTLKHPAAGGENSVLPVDDQILDIPTINAQTIRLLNVFIGFTLVIGSWMILKSTLPAFSFLERIVLWQHLVISDNQQSYQPVTLTNLMLAGLYFFMVLVSVRNFSGVMELLVFRRLAIDAGGRYAVNLLARYILVTIGFISIANELGGNWSQVQWLVAALSVGLGFGLQEIFANLVSGIILLFERPIRVGDTVTIGTVSGKVSRIQLRATTLVDEDSRDLIVPNKTFITSQWVNWTLTDTVTRIVMPVGIAYGSDIELALNVMIDTVQSTPLILVDPVPSVLLDSIGENSLNFIIRTYVSELSNQLLAKHDLNIRLEKALREHNIVML